MVKLLHIKVDFIANVLMYNTCVAMQLILHCCLQTAWPWPPPDYTHFSQMHE